MKNKRNSKELPAINPRFQKLIEGCHQVKQGKEALRHYEVGRIQNGKNNNSFSRFSVNVDGELIELHLETRLDLDYTLLSECKNLISLSIIKSNLKSIPEEIFKIKTLSILNLSKNEIADIPDSIKNLFNLSYLDLSDNKITTVKSLINNKEITRLDLDKNKIKEIPEEFFKNMKLRFIDLDSNQIEKIPDSIGHAKEIILLSISNNILKTLPESLFEIKTIEHLSASQNSITEIPKNVKQAENLDFLDLAQNELAIMPKELLNLQRIQFVNLSTNKIKDIPAIDKNNSQLKMLILDYNIIERIPESFDKLRKLNFLSLEENPLPIPDPSFHDLNPAEKIQTLLSIQNSERLPLKQAKILVVGDERVGKTSVINRLLGKPHDENQTSTQGIDISALTMDDYQTNIWDFAGQELTHQTHQFFLSERSLYLYVLDAQKEDNQARDLHWLSTIKSYSENSPIIVVINHSDQNLNYQFDKQRYQDKFQIVDVIYTSACNLNTLSDEVKTGLGDSISKLSNSIKRQLPKLPGIERELPLSWHKIKECLEIFKLENNVIEKDLYEKECEKAGVTARPLQNALLKILNSIGTVVAYPNEFRLKLTQILKPQWVTNAVYKIIRTPSKTPGIYSETFIGEILNEDYNHGHQQWLIDLLIKFELGFRLNNNNDLLIPMRLPSVMPSFDRDKYQKGLNIRFNYHRKGLLKQNVLPQLIVRMHHYIDEKTNKYWRHGLFVRLDDSQGVIIADEPNQCIDVYLTQRNDKSKTLLSWIRSNLAEIEQAQTKANKDGTTPYIEQIALFDDAYSQIIGYVNYQRVERASNNNKEFVSVEVENIITGDLEDKDFNVSDLLGLYKEINSQKFEISKFIFVLRDTLLRLTEMKLRIISENEDDTNDRLRESLRAAGYSVSDQSRGGQSGTGKSVGERDLVVLNEFGQQACILEAMVLHTFNHKTITEHFNKLTKNYNTHGNPIDFLVTYAKVKSIGSFWSKYKTAFSNIEDKTDSYTEKLNLKFGVTSLTEEPNAVRKIVHIIVNFGIQH